MFKEDILTLELANGQRIPNVTTPINGPPKALETVAPACLRRHTSTVLPQFYQAFEAVWLVVELYCKSVFKLTKHRWFSLRFIHPEVIMLVY